MTIADHLLNLVDNDEANETTCQMRCVSQGYVTAGKAGSNDLCWMTRYEFSDGSEVITDGSDYYACNDHAVAS